MSIVWCDDWGIMDVLVLSIHFASLCQLRSFSGCLYKNVLLFLFHIPRPQKCFLAFCWARDSIRHAWNICRFAKSCKKNRNVVLHLTPDPTTFFTPPDRSFPTRNMRDGSCVVCVCVLLSFPEFLVPFDSDPMRVFSYPTGILWRLDTLERLLCRDERR